MNWKTKLLPSLLLVCSISTVQAEAIYQQPADFINEVFKAQDFQTKTLWPNKSQKKEIKNILGEAYSNLRIRYWVNDKKTAWVLDKIGKVKPITVGFVIANNKIKQVRVLIFRESRGWEVKNSFFTEQFNHAQLNEKSQLSKSIANISGATLSVRAIKKLAALALFLNQQVTANGS